MYVFLYNISLLAFRLGIWLVAPFNNKARLWLKGRTGIFQQLEKVIGPGDKIIWIHCASLGEFEQGRPVLEKIKREYPDYKILLTFFSPSGYEVRKDYPLANHIFYLPVDSASNARKFLDIVNPSLVIFVKYEFWYYYFKNTRDKKIPFLLISAVFRPGQPFFKWWGALYRNMLQSFSHVFVQDRVSGELLQSLGMDKNITVAGDTRFDRVSVIAEKFEPIIPIEDFCKGKKTIVAGSTWGGDEKILQEVFEGINDPLLQLIIAPHETGREHLEQLKKLFPSAIFYTEWLAGDNRVGYYSGTSGGAGNRVLIIDSIGLLSRLYHYAGITYIGGGFTRDGIHNILEAAVYGKPVVFGPVYEKYREAVELIDAGGAKSFTTATELNQIFISLFKEGRDYREICLASANYVAMHRGATEKITAFIQEKRLLTN